MKASSAVTDASIVGVVLLTFIIVLVFVVAAWLIYAYRNPNSQSGIWLIQVCSFLVTGSELEVYCVCNYSKFCLYGIVI
jgi:apolipoprotein N-acyltransferase